MMLTDHHFKQMERPVAGLKFQEKLAFTSTKPIFTSVADKQIKKNLMRRRNYSSGSTNFVIVTYNKSRHFCGNHKREAAIVKSFFQNGKKLPLAIQFCAPLVKSEWKLQEENEPPIPQAPAPFQPTLNNARNILRQAYRAQSAVGWENFMKGWIVRQWETYIALHIRQKQIGLPSKEWAAKLIIARWDHLHQIWTFRNGVLHENNQGRIARYKLEALQRNIEVVWNRYNVQQGRMDTTLQGHFQQWDIINNLIHDIKACWSTLYLDETETQQHSATPDWRHSSCGVLALVNEPTTQLFEQGIVATFLFVQVRTNWIRESAIKIKDVYYYCYCYIFYLHLDIM
jgi:hypothetical protein